MSNHSSTKDFEKFQRKLRAVDVMPFLFLWSSLVLGQKIMTLKEPVLRLHSENMVTLRY